MLQQLIDIEIEIRERELWEESRHLYSNSLVNFVRDSWNILEPESQFITGWHIEAMCEHLQAVTKGEITRLLINVPPGMMKSLLVGVFWPAWEWGVCKMPHLRYICAAHSQSLSIRDNVRARRLVMSSWYQNRFKHVKLTSDQNAKIKFENTFMGFREAIAAGSITGSRGDRVIIDDPLSVEDSYSDTVRESRKLWFLEAVPTRLNQPSSSAIVVIMQRLHDEDTSGIIIDRNLGYEHLCLPMEFESARKCKTKIGFADPRTQEGELLFPERFTQEAVKNLKSVLGEYATAGQLQQTPIPRGGSIIKSEWIKIVDEIPNNFTYTLQSYDLAFKTGEENDFSVGTTWGMLNDQIYLVDVMIGKYEYPLLLSMAQANIKKYNTNVVLIEDKASGISLIQSLKRELGSKLHAIRVDTNKVARVHAVTHLLEGGKVFIKKADWNKAFLAEMTRFPFAAHDDQVDSTTQALAFFDKMRRPAHQVQSIDLFTR